MSPLNAFIYAFIGMVLAHGFRFILAGFRWRPLRAVHRLQKGQWITVMSVPDDIPVMYRLYPSRRFALQA